MNISGRSLELFFVDGRPDGMLTAEVFNWTGHVLRFPRTQIKEALGRRETEHTGVYVLIGERDGEPHAYIGEAEDVRHRLRDHIRDKTKEWWDTAIIITSAADNLHKAHVKYLESRLVEIARDVSAVSLGNSNTPPRSSLTEAAVSNMESFLDTLMMVLPAVRIDMFMSKKRSSKPTANSDADALAVPTFEFIMPKHNIRAVAKLIDGEMVVQAGSEVRGAWAGPRYNKAHYYNLHDELLQKGIISTTDGVGIFTENYAFSSASAAAAICIGRTTNGRTDWKLVNKKDTTYAEWEDQQIEDTPE
ncbi:GIY-YIG nuclease family protein [Marivivens donghaensis]|uniref:GIY-YIG nuclease family protein n=1 Tax=Marivivens donghaensis TaxID=1699413 RepID=A0ABX0VZI1_9RHOB|nr:GIY-YIG nuclease family protein [Marivivens donghaensis]NIY73361.1 GIY-YIG nuclease family protein [Marivivens donghaensis]